MNKFKKARVSGTVTYLNQINQRVPVPRGPCELCDHNGLGPFLLQWEQAGEKHQIELALHEYAQYLGSKDLVVSE
jgi:hypothetical protein